MLERLIHSFFKTGALIVRLPSGRAVSVGGAREEDAALIVHITTDKTARKIARNPSIGVGEGYMDGTFVIERGELYEFIELATANTRLGKPRKGPGYWLRRWRTYSNKPNEAQRNVAHHYDLSGELYRLFLDEDLQYSCAYFPRAGISLEEAQAAKKRHIIGKLLLEPGQRVLDIGCGWGGMALTLAQEHGVDVTGITLSKEQHESACRRALLTGLQNHARFELRDYRHVQGPYDRIVSVGMFEHVGPGDHNAYFGAVHRLLTDDGVALVHTIGRIDGPAPGDPWIEKYIFPGGRIPALSEIAAAVERSGLIMTDVETLRLHYADTLRAWRERFLANHEEAVQLYNERFCRMWEFYLCGAEAGFRVGNLVVYQVQLAKRRDALPMTRDYMTDFDRAGEARARIAAE